MRCFLFPVFFSFLVFGGSLFFPLDLSAQERQSWMFPGDNIEEIEGRGLIIRSDPSGARIYIDGIDRGYTPLHLENLRAGRYAVQVEKEGFTSRQFRVRVRAGSVIEVSLQLEQAVGKVLLTIQPDSGSPGKALLPMEPRISVDGVVYSQNFLELPIGFRTILVQAFGWEDFSREIFIEEGSYRELEFNLKPAPFKVSGTSISRSRFNPANPGSLGTTTSNFRVSAPGRGTLTVYDHEWKPVFVQFLDPFKTWSQSVTWNGRDEHGEILPDGTYSLIVEVFSLPWDDALPVQDGFVMNVGIDSSRVINPLTVSSGKSGLLYAPLPVLLPPGSFQIEGSLLTGNPPVSGGAWKSLPFAVSFRISPLERLEVSAALNVNPCFEGDTGVGAGGGAKWAFHTPGEGGPPLGAAAGLVFSWTTKTGLTPFGMASGFEFFFPFSLDFGRFFSFSLTPAVLWTGDEGFPWEPAPRLLVSGAFLMRMSFVGAGLSIRSEFDFTRDKIWLPGIMAGAEIKIFPPPSSFVFSLMGGVWAKDGSLGGFGGFGMGMIH